MISCISPHAVTQKVLSPKPLYDHSRDILDKDWKMEFIRSGNNQAKRNPCITDHLFNLCIMMCTSGKLVKMHTAASLHGILLCTTYS